MPVCLSLRHPGQQDPDTCVYRHADTQCQGRGHRWCMVRALAPTPGCLLVAGQPLGSWPGSAVMVVVVVVVLVPLFAGILWFVLSR